MPRLLSVNVRLPRDVAWAMCPFHRRDRTSCRFARIVAIRRVGTASPSRRDRQFESPFLQQPVCLALRLQDWWNENSDILRQWTAREGGIH